MEVGDPGAEPVRERMPVLDGGRATPEVAKSRMTTAWGSTSITKKLTIEREIHLRKVSQGLEESGIFTACLTIC